MSKKTGCEFEHSVVGAVKTGTINNQIAEHIKSCADCRETVKITRFFQITLMNEPQPKKLPAVGFIWFKSRLREKQRAAENVTKPILIVQTAAVVIFIGLFIWLLNTDFSNLLFLESALHRVFASIEQIVVLLGAGIACFAFVCSTLIYILRRFLLEE